MLNVFKRHRQWPNYLNKYFFFLFLMELRSPLVIRGFNLHLFPHSKHDQNGQHFFFQAKRIGTNLQF